MNQLTWGVVDVTSFEPTAHAFQAERAQASAATLTAQLHVERAAVGAVSEVSELTITQRVAELRWPGKTQ